MRRSVENAAHVGKSSRHPRIHDRAILISSKAFLHQELVSHFETSRDVVDHSMIAAPVSPKLRISPLTASTNIGAHYLRLISMERCVAHMTQPSNEPHQDSLYPFCIINRNLQHLPTQAIRLSDVAPWTVTTS